MTKYIFENNDADLFTSDSNNAEPAKATDEKHAETEGLPTSDAALKTQWDEVRSRTLERLYKNDPYIREGIDAQRQVEKSRERITSSEVVSYDQDGALLPPKKSLLTGGTTNDAIEYMRAIRKSYERS